MYSESRSWRAWRTELHSEMIFSRRSSRVHEASAIRAAPWMMLSRRSSSDGRVWISLNDAGSMMIFCCRTEDVENESKTRNERNERNLLKLNNIYKLGSSRTETDIRWPKTTECHNSLLHDKCCYDGSSSNQVSTVTYTTSSITSAPVLYTVLPSTEWIQWQTVNQFIKEVILTSYQVIPLNSNHSIVCMCVCVCIYIYIYI